MKLQQCSFVKKTWNEIMRPSISKRASHESRLQSQRSKHGFYEEFSVIQTDANYSSSGFRKGSKTLIERVISYALYPYNSINHYALLLISKIKNKPQNNMNIQIHVCHHKQSVPIIGN